MHITGMTISDIPPFTEQVDMEFDERVNVFIGPNASGKSTILRALRYRIEIDNGFNFRLSEDWDRVTRTPFFRHGNRGRDSQSDATKEYSGIIPWLYFPATRLSLPFTYDDQSMQKLQPRNRTLVFDDGEEMEPNPLESMHSALSLYCFDGSGVHQYNKGVADLVREGRRGPRSIQLAASAKKKAYDCVQSICSDILIPGQSPSDYIYEQPIVEDEISITNIHDDMAIATSDNTFQRLFLGDLSLGTQGTLLWIWYLAIELANFNFGPLRGHIDQDKKPAILLIDEIENHLHPTWQRRVIPALLEHFPGLQIFATTHSPFVVAGLRAGQVHMLERENGVVKATPNKQDIIGWTTDEILRTFMGVDEPTDQLTINRRERLLELRGKESLTDVEAVEVEELRRQVNEDFLSSSTPLEAQRERYGDMMLEFLRSRQSELSQDGS